MDFAYNLRLLRNESGLTQKECATALSVDYANYNKWENGSNPNFDTLCAIADYFDVSTDFLLGRSAFRNSMEEKALSNEDQDASEIAISAYRKIEGCLRSLRSLYDEKIHGYSGSENELPLLMAELVSENVAVFQKLADILRDYRDFSDCDSAVYSFLEVYRGSEVGIRVVAEILRIGREI